MDLKDRIFLDYTYWMVKHNLKALIRHSFRVTVFLQIFFFNYYIFNLSSFSVVHVVDLSTNRSSTESSTIQHSMHIVQISLDQWGETTSRYLTILDKNKDLYLVQARNSSKQYLKLGMVRILNKKHTNT